MRPRVNADGRGDARVLCGSRRRLGRPLTRLNQELQTLLFEPEASKVACQTMTSRQVERRCTQAQGRACLNKQCVNLNKACRLIQPQSSSPSQASHIPGLLRKECLSYGRCLRLLPHPNGHRP